MSLSAHRNAWILALIATLGALGMAALLWPRRGSDADEAEGMGPDAGFEDIPKIDVHVHVGLGQWEQALEIMDANGIRTALNASGGTPGAGLERSAEIAERTGGRLRPYCNVSLARVGSPGWDRYVRETLTACEAQGAVGLKIFKSLGLGLVDADGTLVAVDDPRFDVLFETAGEVGLPVLIHSGDPQAFFRPPTPDNERYEELSAHPGWSFFGDRPDGQGRWPTWHEVFAQYERRVARHPGTTFVGAHFGNAPEDPCRVARMLEAHPNLFIETGARIPEIGRHPPDELRRFFERFEDRILFGTDLQVTQWGRALGSAGEDPDPPSRVPAFFDAHFRYFETSARGMPHPTPIQGDWTIDGLGLPRSVLERLYWKNADRVFGLGG